MRIDLSTCRDPDLLAAEVRRLRCAIAALADQDATLSVCDGNVTVTMDATLTDAEREAVERAAALDEARRWIPVEERLPEPDTDVLVVVHPCWSERPYQEIGQWRSRSGLDGQGGGYWGGIPEDASPVTHWAPLLPVPEPPATATEQT